MLKTLPTANELRVPLPVLRVRMGHVDIAHTMRYVRATRDPASLDAWDALLESEMPAATPRKAAPRGTKGRK